jgi:site-specific DNA recombinase
MAHPPITGKEQFEQAQAILAGRGSRTAHKTHRRLRPYALRGVLLRGLCDRRMPATGTTTWPITGAGSPPNTPLANHVDHPKTVRQVRQADRGNGGN